MAVPKYNEFFPSFLTFLSDGQEHKLKDIRAYCADSFNLSEDDRAATIPSGKNMIIDRVGWARTHLKKAGLIESPRQAVFVITPLGKEVLQKGTECLTLEYVHQLQVKNGQAMPDTVPDDSANRQDAQSPMEAIDIALAQLKSELADDLLAEVLKMDEYDFERLVVDLLVKMGYGKPEQNSDAVTKKSGDEGIDGIVKADRFGFDAVYTQAKRWKADSHIGRPEIQKFLGAMVGQGAMKGLFITTGQFSNGAVEFVKKQLNHKIVLIDGKQLAELMIEYGLGVATVDVLKIQRIDTDYFNTDD